MYKRPLFNQLLKRMSEPRRFIQVLSGPRQTGKTTLARQLINDLAIPSHYATADEPALKDRIWIEQQWETARAAVAVGGSKHKALLVLDEIQKIPQWPETVKRLWDEDSASRSPLRVLILGSAALLAQKGLSESLTGRYEVTHVTHWSYAEMKAAFEWDADRYIYYGGYPGAAVLVDDYERWSAYVREALIEPTISRDILLMTRVDKPALLRQLFDLACNYSGQILSYQKMLGQLQDAGNTTTLAHYLDLLEGAGLVVGLQKFAGTKIRQRGSSPKLLALNTALMSVSTRLKLREAKNNGEIWGRIVETAIGASLANHFKGKPVELLYWRKANLEVDYVLKLAEKVTAIEVKSGKKAGMPGMRAFLSEHKVQRKLLVGAGGIPVDEFLLADPSQWLN
ncbi:MAG: ATP-binding protein [Thermoleophilia bacterium]